MKSIEKTTFDIPQPRHEREVERDTLQSGREAYNRIAAETGGDPVATDQLMGEYVYTVDQAYSDGSPEEIDSASAGFVEVMTAPEYAVATSESLNNLPLSSIEPAMRALEAGYGSKAAEIVMNALDNVHH